MLDSFSVLLRSFYRACSVFPCSSTISGAYPIIFLDTLRYDQSHFYKLKFAI